jgi:hypothetical protein
VEFGIRNRESGIFKILTQKTQNKFIRLFLRTIHLDPTNSDTLTKVTTMTSNIGNTATRLRNGFENVVWDSCTFHLPDKAGVADGSSAADKDLFWRETVNGVDEASA